MKSILMVCLGNICRSPLAEGILRKKIEDKSLRIKVDSAGTSNYHIGENPDIRSILSAKKNGIDISKLKGRQFTSKDFETYDLIFVMDTSNQADVLALAKNETYGKKVKLILDELYPDTRMSVPDPYYGNEQDFENVFILLDKACDAIIANLEELLRKEH